MCIPSRSSADRCVPGAARGDDRPVVAGPLPRPWVAPLNRRPMAVPRARSVAGEAEGMRSRDAVHVAQGRAQSGGIQLQEEGRLPQRHPEPCASREHASHALERHRWQRPPIVEREAGQASFGHDPADRAGDRDAARGAMQRQHARVQDPLHGGRRALHLGPGGCLGVNDPQRFVRCEDAPDAEVRRSLGDHGLRPGLPLSLSPSRVAMNRS